MKIKHYIIFMFILCVHNLFSQDYIHCHQLRTLIKIPDVNNIPIVTSNSNDTLTLTFTQQTITDLFANFEIYDFYTAGYGSFYYLKHNSKVLIDTIYNNISPTILEVDPVSPDPIHQDLINALDGKTFRVIKTVSVTDPSSCTDFFGNNLCPYLDVPPNQDMIFSFNYDSNNDIFTVESAQNTSCGNYFSIKMKGGNPNDVNNSIYTLQTWETMVGVSSFNDPANPCHHSERNLFGIMEVLCDYDYFYGNVDVFLDSNTGIIQFTRKMVLSGYEGIEVTENNTASLDDTMFESFLPYIDSDTNYLNIKNYNNQTLKVEIININGKIIHDKKVFQINSIDFSAYPNGLYFVKLTNDKQSKVFKIIKK